MSFYGRVGHAAAFRPAGSALLDYLNPYAASVDTAVASTGSTASVTGISESEGLLGPTSPGPSVNYAGIAQLVSAVGTLGVQAVNAGLQQMSRDQLLQAQRDANALAATLRSQGGTPEQTANVATLINLLNQQTQSASASQGTSTTTIVIVAGLAFAAAYLFTRRRRKNR